MRPLSISSHLLPFSIFCHLSLFSTHALCRERLTGKPREKLTRTEKKKKKVSWALKPNQGGFVAETALL
jgi:hypothetical protein